MTRPDVPADQPLVRTLAEAAVAVHEFYESFLIAGFNRREALELTKFQLKLLHECPTHSPD